MDISLLVSVLHDAIYRLRKLQAIFHHTGIDHMHWKKGTRLLTQTAELLCLALDRRKGKRTVPTHHLHHPGLN